MVILNMFTPLNMLRSNFNICSKSDLNSGGHIPVGIMTFALYFALYFEKWKITKTAKLKKTCPST